MTYHASEGKELLGAREVARLMGCAEKTIRRLAESGQFPAGIKVGALRRWPRSQVLAWIEAKAHGTATAAGV